MTAPPHTGQMSRLMVDHPGWFTTPDGQAHRAFRSGEAEWVLTCHQAGGTFEPTVEVVRQGTDDVDVAPLINRLDPGPNEHPVVDTFDAATLPPPIRRSLKIDAATVIHRVRNPDVWDAMLMPIFRHRIAIRDAAARYRAFCVRYGTVVSTETSTTLLPPRPETVATLEDDPRVIGRRMSALCATAHAYLRLHLGQASGPPVALYDRVLRIHGIGKASAARIVADTTGDFTFYEHAGFGDRKYWQQRVTELHVTHQDDVRMLWKSCTYQQRSTAIALATHQRLTDSDQAEAADSNALHQLIQAQHDQYSIQ